MLFSNFKVKDLVLANRIVMSPMCQYMAGEDGKVTDWHFLHYTSRAIGSVGLVMIESTGIVERGRISSRDLGLWEDSHIDGLRNIVEAVHQQKGKIAIQLNHAGRKSTVEDSTPVAPSALAFSQEFRIPQALTKNEIKQIVEAFAKAAKRAVLAGFDAVEIHAAHGYLLNQFLSPISNQREDEYGGAPKNRVRIVGEVLEAVRSVLPIGMPITVRVSAHDYEIGGNTPEDIAGMLNLVKDKGIDVVHVSSGGITPVTPRAYPGYQISFALTVKDQTGLPVIGGGLITEAVQAEQIVKSGVELVFLGRELLRNPYWPLKAAHELQQEISWPESYVRSKY